jgi:hypothetical protein
MSTNPWQEPDPSRQIPMAQPIRPPTDRGFVPPPVTVSRWPTVLGTIAMAYAVLTLLCGIGGAISAKLVGSTLPGSFHQADIMPGGLLFVVVSVVSWGLALLLLITGIGIYLRRHWSVLPVRLWAVAYMIQGVVGAVMGMSAVQTALRSQAMPPRGGPSRGAFEASMFIGMVGGMAVTFAPAVFTLIWFGRAKIKAEVANWR